MKTATKKATYTATFQEGIADAVLVKVTRNRRRLDLAALPAGVIDYLSVKKTNGGTWVFDVDGLRGWDDLVACAEVTEKKQGRRKAPRQATATFTVEPHNVEQIEPAEQLPRDWNDGAHCGLTDWYLPLEAAITAALARGKGYAWTTGWYGSKKEIASACITQRDGEITVEVGVSDDFDTLGRGEQTIRFTKNLDRVRDAISAAWTEANRDLRDNAAYVGFSVGRGGGWEFTLILPNIGNGGLLLDSPPGDYYHRWGWQEVEEGEDVPSEIPTGIAEDLRNWAGNTGRWAGGRFTFGEWTIKAWEDDSDA